MKPPELDEWPRLIEPGMRVLDVGCGGNPSDHATVYCDRHWSADGECTAHGATFDPACHAQPFVVGDAQALPFRDKAFDFVICKHLLEHLENPLVGCRELERVAPMGYIELPSVASDAIFGWPVHLWLCRKDGDMLVFSPRDSQPFWRENPGGFRGREFAEQASLRHALDEAGLWRVCHIWRGKIEARIDASH